MQLMSDVRLGVDLGLIEEVQGDLLKELLVLQRPANLQLYTNRTLNVLDRDRKELVYLDKINTKCISKTGRRECLCLVVSQKERKSARVGAGRSTAF